MTREPKELIILAADIGGTHLNLALLQRRGPRFEIQRRASQSSQGERSLLGPIQRFLEECLPLKADIACISGAGPVESHRIRLTNLPWDIEGDALSEALGIPVRLINDFSAIARGVLMLDPTDRQQLIPLPHPDGSIPTPEPLGTLLIVGAGTGLGVGYALRSGDDLRVMPSEGGHIGLPLLDEETLGLWRYLRERHPGPPGAEAAVSGPGIAMLLAFLAEKRGANRSVTVEAILGLPPEDRPAAVANGANTDPLCQRAMELFVDLYARVCAELCAAFLPTGGIFLAGGIAAKNEARFLEGHRFMATFEANYRSHLNALTRRVPVYIVRDYDISLYGAAQAAQDPEEPR